MNKYYIFLLLAGVLIYGCSGKKDIGLMEKLAIEVKDTSRAFFYTNKFYGQYYGETGSDFKEGWQGWTLKEQRIFNDYSFTSDGHPLLRNEASAKVYPYILKRYWDSGIEESFFFADSLDLIVVELKNLKTRDLKFTLKNFSGSDGLKFSGNTVSAPVNSLQNYSIFITSNGVIKNAEIKVQDLILDIQPADDVKIVLQVSDKPVQLKTLLAGAEGLILKKEKRIEEVLKPADVKTNDSEFDKALMWARISLDALITRQDVKGIFAGLPWFNNYWGRDTFISLPGATFTTGNLKDAREILLSFASYQNKDKNSSYYGRIPNRITLKETIYNTADGTPWFVIQAYNYFNYSNDTDFLKQIYPAVKLAYYAAIKKHTDQNGFLRHADAETWMDAVGPNGPWSPRGDRAVDIQALWHQQQLYTSEIAGLLKDSVTAREALASSKKTAMNFEKFFVNKNSNLLYDRLKPDGRPDSTIRPNAFFALNDPELFALSRTRLNILSNMTSKVVYPHGVASLSQDDPNFHPYHQYSPYYVKDAAYHNGIIWQWNTGPVIQALCGFARQDMAWKLTKELTRQILHRGAAGTLAELMDALPRNGEKEPRLSGASSQAWSLAEYIRNFYQDYLGIKPNAPKNALYLLPTIPDELKEIETDQVVNGNKVRIKYTGLNDVYRIELDGSLVRDSLDIGISIFSKADANFQLKTVIYKNDRMSMEVPFYSNSLKDLVVNRNGNRISVSCQIYNDPPEISSLYSSIKFAQPHLNRNLSALRGPGYDLLSNNLIKKASDKAAVIFDKSAPANDEKYLYPLNPNFKPGILDLTGFRLKEDDANYYFTLKYRELANPGWHNEYGFQLTYTAICISADDAKTKSSDPGANSGYRLPAGREFSCIINTGGGFEVKDASGKVVCAYLPLPEDIRSPLGSTATGTVEFAIPKKYIGKISAATKITLLTGAQDDHGGAGVGEFRNVAAKAAEWTGGGKMNSSGSNVYDIFTIN